MTVDRRLVAAVRRELAARADPVKAPQMQAYMKSELPFRGVQAAGVRDVQREVFAAHPLGGFDDWRDTVLELWRHARFREERYAAIGLTGHRLYREHALSLDALPLFEELIVDGAWWDLVDIVAARRIGPLLLEHPAELAPELRRWSRDGDRWRRRTSIICQLGAKNATDVQLLRDCIEANAADRDFFVRKAIGWALREYSKADGPWVRRYVREHQELSPLSRREALKWLEHVHVPRTRQS